jgi:hypothetical protein
MTEKTHNLSIEVRVELERAQSLFAPINGPHEGLGVIMEEFEEFKTEVYKYNLGKNRDTRPQMRTELIQLAAMALRTIHDVIDLSEPRNTDLTKEPAKIDSRKGFVVYDTTPKRDLWWSGYRRRDFGVRISTMLFGPSRNREVSKKFRKDS